MTAGTPEEKIDDGKAAESPPARRLSGNGSGERPDAMTHGNVALAEPALSFKDRLASAGGIPLPRLAGLFSTLISLALLVAVGVQFNQLSLPLLAEMIPSSPLFWLVFAAYYLAGPVCEWIVYRHLWNLPVAGIGALLRKLVSNELLLGYLGEAQFYAWARSRTNMTTAPFGAIKDMTILSALTGNIATLVMLVFAWPLVASGAFGIEMKPAFLSLGVVLVTSFLIFLFRQKLFTLPRKELIFITVVHFIRIVVVIGLAALLWHLVMPQVAVGMWLVLATLRMLVSRLPLIPNKDVVFAGLAVFILGQEGSIAGLLTMMAALLLVAHLVVGGIFALAGLFESGRTS